MTSSPDKGDGITSSERNIREYLDAVFGYEGAHGWMHGGLRFLTVPDGRTARSGSPVSCPEGQRPGLPRPTWCPAGAGQVRGDP